MSNVQFRRVHGRIVPIRTNASPMSARAADARGLRNAEREVREQSTPQHKKDLARSAKILGGVAAGAGAVAFGLSPLGRKLGQQALRHGTKLYAENRTVANVGLAAGTFIASSVVAEKSRNAIASKVYYKGRKGFNNGLANFAWDATITGGLTYAAAQRFAPVRHGFSTIGTAVRRAGGF